MAASYKKHSVLIKGSRLTALRLQRSPLGFSLSWDGIGGTLTERRGDNILCSCHDLRASVLPPTSPAMTPSCRAIICGATPSACGNLSASCAFPLQTLDVSFPPHLKDYGHDVTPIEFQLLRRTSPKNTTFAHTITLSPTYGQPFSILISCPCNPPPLQWQRLDLPGAGAYKSKLQ